MPGTVQTASPSVVFPKHLYSAYRQVATYSRVMNEYPDGSSERRAIESTSRKRWTLTAPLSASAKATLKAFYTARRGGPFWFYELSETSPQWAVDMSGANTNGRYAARFEGPFVDASQYGPKWQASMEIVEVG